MKLSRANNYILLVPAIAVLAVFLFVPLAGMLRSSFFMGDGPYGTGWTLQQYINVLSDGYYLSVLFQTLVLSLGAALICLFLGYPVAYSLARMPQHKRRIWLLVIILPLTLSLVIVVFGWLVVLGTNGLFNTIFQFLNVIDSPKQFLYTRGAVLLVLVQEFLPFMILPLMSVLMQVDETLEQAASNLRANRFETFTKVIVPLSEPGILAGFTLVFILSASAFITPQLIGGARVQMTGSVIYQQVLVVLGWPLAAALSFVLMFATFAVVWLCRLLIKRIIKRMQKVEYV